MTNGTDRRARTTEELWPVTAHARVVAGVIRDVRERRYFCPVLGWDFVTGDASGLVFGRGVRKFRVINR